MIHVRYVGRMGNNMFQYAIGRILHEISGRKMTTSNGQQDLREHFGIEIGFGQPRFHNQEYFPNAVSELPGKDMAGQIVSIVEKDWPSLETMLDHAGDAPLVVWGFFQRAKYLIPWRDKIREWFECGESEERPELAIHYRRGDYLISNQQVEDDYYEKARQTFVGYEATNIGLSDVREHLIGNDIADFKKMKSARNLIMSNSTFSWWAAFLGHHDRVVMPRPKSGKFWSADSDQQLYVPGWEVIDCE